MSFSRPSQLLLACLAFFSVFHGSGVNASVAIGGAIQNGGVALGGAASAAAVTISTLAGSAGSPGAANGSGSVARFSFPAGITAHTAYLYVADTNNHTIRMVEIATSVAGTLAGQAGVAGSSDGLQSAARFNYPHGITTDGTHLYVSDTENQIIRKIVIATGAVSTLAGTLGVTGSADGTGPAALFNFPTGITTDGINLYVTDTNNQTIRQVVIATGVVTTLAGTAGSLGSSDGIGAAARFFNARDITTDGTSLYVTDTANQTIRRLVIATGVVTTLAGSAGNAGTVDGAGTAAQFYNPRAITTDGSNLYVSEDGHTLRRIVIASGMVSTLAGTAGVAGSADGSGTVAQFNYPHAITTDGSRLYLADTFNHTLRSTAALASAPVVSLSASLLSFGNQAVGGTSAAQTVNLANTGNAVLNISGITTTSSNYGLSTTCGATLLAGTSCTISVTFMPTVTGTINNFIAINTGAGGDGQMVALNGTGVSIPGAPVILSVYSDNGQASVSFTAPADTGGSAITGYTVMTAPAGGVDMHAGTTALTHTITGLSNGTTYTFSVAAANSVGTGTATTSAAVTVGKFHQSLSLASMANIAVGASGSISAGASSGLAPSFSSSTPATCTVNGNSVTGIAAGICNIVVSQAGDASYNAATPAMQSISILGTLALVPSWNLAGNSAGTPFNAAATFSDPSKVATVWKWDNDSGTWAFHTPTLADGGAAYSLGKDYMVLDAIHGGEGFWVNAATASTVALPAIPNSCVGTGTALAVRPSWNLLANNVNDPMPVSATFSDPGKVFSVWKWIPETGKWAFFTPTQADGGAAYAAGKGFDTLTTIHAGEGFWVNAQAAFTVPLPEVTAGCGCEQAAVVDKSGNVVFPPEAFETELPVNVDENLGSIAALYPGMDTSTDAFYPHVPCETSIGGTLPAEVPPTQGELDSEAFLQNFETTQGPVILEQLQNNPLPAVSQLADFNMGTCAIRTEASAAGPGSLVPVKCDDPIFLNPSMPFEGRDIIYVHGLDIHPLKEMILHPTGPASKVWPQDASEFLSPGGYYRTNAENYWRPHITEHLSSQDPLLAATAGWQWTSADAQPIYVPKSNRYLVVAWSANQTIEYAQHALLTQIQMAMNSNTNVVTPAGYPAQHVRPFCANGCIIIGHSTGPLITSSAMGLANAGFFGPGGKEVSRHVLAHVSFAGAISGSRLATIGMAVALAGPAILAPGLATVSSLLCPILEHYFGQSQACILDMSFVANSILRDLIPAVAQGVWGPAIAISPVPTVTFAGGHPVGNQGPLRLFLPGVDDGVVTMNSACGNSNPVFPFLVPPSGLSAFSLWKAFDFSENGDRLTRATSTFISQKNLMALAGPLYLAGGCTPYLSATGMLMPVLSAWGGSPLDARRRYNNHYSFMQSMAEHSHDGGNATPNEWPSQFGFPASMLREYAPYIQQIGNNNAPVGNLNKEESRAVTDASIYTRILDINGTRLAKPLDMHEIRRGRRVSFHMPFNIGGCTRQGFARWYCQKWLWKRTYHLADKWEQKQSSHYAYEFVGRR